MQWHMTLENLFGEENYTHGLTVTGPRHRIRLTQDTVYLKNYAHIVALVWRVFQFYSHLYGHIHMDH